MKSIKPTNPLLSLILTFTLLVVTSASALPSHHQPQTQAQAQEQDDASIPASLPLTFSATTTSGTTNTYTIDLYPDSPRLGGATFGAVVSLPPGTRLQKAWVVQGPAPQTRCELGTVPLQPDEHVFFGGDDVVAGASAGADTNEQKDGGEMAIYGKGEPWVGDEEVKFVICEVSAEKTILS